MIIDIVDVIMTSILDILELASSSVDMSVNILILLAVALSFCGCFSFLVFEKSISSLYSKQKKLLTNFKDCLLGGNYERSWTA